MAPSPSKHYNIRVVIEEVTKHEGTGRGDDKTFTSEVVNFKTQRPSLAGAIKATKLAVELAEEEGK